MRVLLVENDAVSGGNVRDLLRAGGHAVNWYRRLADVTLLGEQAHDVMLVALQLPDGSGLDWVDARRRNGDATPVLMLSDHCQPVDLWQPTDSSAEAREVLERVLAAIRHALAQGPSADRNMRSYGHIELDPPSRRAFVRGSAVRLTEREWEVLAVLTENPGRLVAKRELDALVGGPAEPASSNVIEVHVSSLRRKLGRSFIETVRGLGYRICI